MKGKGKLSALSLSFPSVDERFANLVFYFMM